MKDVENAMLDPKNLIYFGRLIFEEKDFIEESEIAKVARSMFDVSIAYALVFRTRDDFNLCHDLVKQALLNLDLIKQNIN